MSQRRETLGSRNAPAGSDAAPRQGDGWDDELIGPPEDWRSPPRAHRAPRRPRGPRTLWTRILLGALIACLLAAGGFWASLAPPLWRPGIQAIAQLMSAGTTKASIGSVKRILPLSGVVVREANQSVGSPSTGKVTALNVRPGDTVTAGEALGTVTVPPPPPPPSPPPLPTASPTAAATASPTPTLTIVTPSPTPTLETVTAPFAGVVASVQVSIGQTVRSGVPLVTLSPNHFDVIAPVPQHNLNELYSSPLSIQATLQDGPGPFACTLISIGGNLSGGPAGRVSDQEVDLRCRVPDSVSVFPGARTSLSVVTGQATGVLVLPVTAVRVVGDQGTVWLAEPGCGVKPQEVSVGIADSSNIQITRGIAEGQIVIDPAPAPEQTVQPILATCFPPAGGAAGATFGASPSP